MGERTIDELLADADVIRRRSGGTAQVVGELADALREADARAGTMLRRLGMLDRLGVTSCVVDCERGDGLLVDAGSLDSETGISTWLLTEPAEGVWRHDESGNEGTLGHLLRAIAWSYDDSREAETGDE